ncbi:nucleotidyltransferase domain-containing protein [Membranihabitans marinus]|uniref:nucleotidyltransferase domain-containing protein n=1 Tax=Membranihabitans marinus TaxID=1227546 RepID=UPI001F2B3204|nr:nucleotidyltransferase domain-containing protein [Membranihabitans marinus]
MMYGLKEKNINSIQLVFRDHPEIEEAILYGSRAIGNYRNGSDIDLTLKGDDISLALLSTLEIQLDDLLLPYLIDLSIYNKIENPDLIHHINEVGLPFYKKEWSLEKTESEKL